MEWISLNKDLVIEIFGATTGLLYLFFSIKQRIWLWPLGIFTSAIYIYVFFAARFYADMGLQVYYLIISIYGWYYWLKGNGARRGGEAPDETAVLAVKKTPSRYLPLLLLTFVILFAGIAWILHEFTDSDIPVWDAFTTAGSIVATWMLARKLLEHWLIWIVVDAVSMGLYIYKELYPTVLLFAVYTAMAMVGFISWRNEMYQPKTQ